MGESDPAGWSPNPAVEGRQPYWDGQSWTTPPRNKPKVKWIAVVAVLTAIGGIGVWSAMAHTDRGADHEHDYLQHLSERGVPTGIAGGARPDFGHAVCKDIAGGEAGASAVIRIANLNKGAQFTGPQAEMIVYWAIADLCPDQSAQSQNRWKDGT
jgi:hypothetical protein